MTTYDDAFGLKSALEDAILKLSGSKSLSSSFLEDNFSREQQDFVADFLKSQEINQLSKEEVLAGLKQLDEKMRQIKPIDIAVAVEPDASFKKKISTWISKNVSTEVFPRYTVNPIYVGGARITYNGNFLDLTLRDKINELPIFKRKI